MTEHKKHEDSGSKKTETITITKTTLWQIVSGVLGLLLIVSLFTGGFGIGASDPTPAQPVPQQQVQPTQPTQPTQPPAIGSITMAQVNDGVTPVKGSDDAQVTMYKWSDFACGFCTRFNQETFGRLETNYIETGKMNYVQRHGRTPNSKPTEAVRCAGEQDKFYEMNQMIFDKGYSGGVPALKQYAEELGLNTVQFNACLDNGEMTDKVNQDIQQGQAIGLSGTPGFIITSTVSGVTVEDVQNAIPAQFARNMFPLRTDTGVGVRVSGALPYEAFEAVIEALLGN
ncbi:MAG: DsbA family protein [Candidatus Woesearchaeota archaeon]